MDNQEVDVFHINGFLRTFNILVAKKVGLTEKKYTIRTYNNVITYISLFIIICATYTTFRESGKETVIN